MFLFFVFFVVIASCLRRWVRCVAFDPSNEWFVTGSADRTIKIWDTASGQLKLTLTGHIEQVTAAALSPRHPYMFSAGLDKKVMCWDLEYNKVPPPTSAATMIKAPAASSLIHNLISISPHIAHR
jgi:WD40 repeat protein